MSFYIICYDGIYNIAPVLYFMNKYYLYLAGSIRIWREDFYQHYSSSFNKRISLFEAGTLNIPPNHTEIAPEVSDVCVQKIISSDAILVYMKSYTPKKYEGYPGVDSSWECGFAYGLKKPIIALIDNVEHAKYFEDQWMLSHNITAFLTTNIDVVSFIKDSTHYRKPTVLFANTPDELEQTIIKYLDKMFKK